jgi:hypothetical protein
VGQARSSSRRVVTPIYVALQAAIGLTSFYQLKACAHWRWMRSINCRRFELETEEKYGSSLLSQKRLDPSTSAIPVPVSSRAALRYRPPPNSIDSATAVDPTARTAHDCKTS